MSEENTAPEGQEEKQPDPIEVTAREHGWRPKEEFEADERNANKKWRSAEDFMDRKSLFDKIDSQGNELKTLRKGIQALGTHYTNVEKEAFKRALAELKAKRTELLQDGEFAKAEVLRDEMDVIKDKLDSVQPVVPVEATPPAEFVEWTQRNTWYKTDPAMTRFADDLGRRLAAEGASPGEVLKQVEERTRLVYAEKFPSKRNPNKDAAPEMVGPGKKAESIRGFRLTEDQERAMNNMIKSGAPITREQYIADLKKMES